MSKKGNTQGYSEIGDEMRTRQERGEDEDEDEDEDEVRMRTRRGR